MRAGSGRVKILSVAYPFAPVRGDTAGGAEQVLATLDREFCLQGHQSYVIAGEGSVVSGELLAIPLPKGAIDGEVQRRAWSNYRRAIVQAVDMWAPDLIHLHGLDFIEYLPAPGIPVIATLHLPPAWYDPAVFAMDRPETWLHCVSQSQQHACPKTANLLPFIANGVPDITGDLALVPAAKRRFALSLGRICPEKGYHLAFEASEQAGVPFLLAGQIYNYDDHQWYFKERILPLCNRRARFIGAVGPVRKQRLMGSARCLLVPSLAPETSSLVAMEAAMCGTPVVAFRAGALPEVVQDGVTGFLVDDVRQMADAIGACGDLDPALCRETALARFSAHAMAAGYLRMYENLIRS